LVPSRGLNTDFTGFCQENCRGTLTLIYISRELFKKQKQLYDQVDAALLGVQLTSKNVVAN